MQPAEWLTPPGARADAVVLYLHGGGYVIGSSVRSRRSSPISPGLPPLRVHVGSDEVLLDDALGLTARARQAGVDATVEEWPAMIHVWPWFLPMLAEAERAVGAIGESVRARTG